jgi:transposase
MKLVVIQDSNYKLIKTPSLKLAKLVMKNNIEKFIQSPKPCCAKPNERSFKTTTRKKSKIRKKIRSSLEKSCFSSFQLWKEL